MLPQRSKRAFIAIVRVDLHITLGLIYNHRMVIEFRNAVCMAALCQSGIAGFAFQAPADERVQIVPIVKSNKPAERLGPQTVVRVNASLVLIPVHVTTATGAP